MLKFAKMFSGAFSPTSVVARVIVPELDNDKSDNSTVILKTIEMMVDQFGGATVTDGQGYWRDDATGDLYKDDVKVIESAADLSRRAKRTVERIGQMILDDTDQVAVYTSFNGRPKIIYRKR